MFKRGGGAHKVSTPPKGYTKIRSPAGRPGKPKAAGHWLPRASRQKNL